jgi:putative hemolysin
MLVNGFQMLILRVAGVEEEEEEEEREQKILDSMEDGSKAGILDESEREMIENLIEFKDLDVGEVMTPRTEMAALQTTATLDEVVDQMVESNFSRIMIYEENRDNVIGFVHVRDCLPFWKKDDAPSLKDLLHAVYYVPDTKSIRSLFQEFKAQHLHIAIVLDEYGGTAGLITLEDILEEIVGDIVDEHQSEDEEICKMISENEVQVQGRMRVSELEEVFSLEFEENDSYDSVGGMVISHLGRIPAQGESGELNTHGLNYKVLDANERRIEKIQFTKIITPVET